MARSGDKKGLLSSYGLLNDMTPAPSPGKSVGRTTFTNTLHAQVKKTYSNDVLAGKQEFLAIVLRDENYYERDIAPLGSPQAIAPNTFAGDTTKMIKVRAAIPEIHAAFPLPTSSDQHGIIDLYPIFACSRETLGGRQPAIGEVVRVTFGDLATMSQPILLGLVSNGNKIPGSHLKLGQRCNDPIRDKMRAKAAAGTGLQTPDLSKATNPSTGGAMGIGDNYTRAVAVTQALSQYNIPVEILLAFMSIESKGKADAVRFEPHIFLGKGARWQKLDGKRGRPELKGAMPDGVPFERPGRKSWSLKASETNKNALINAMRHDARWAIYSTSFGTYQVMGFHALTNNNRKFLGKTPEKFWEDFQKNPEKISDELIVSWIKKNQNWRDVINNAPDRTKLDSIALKKLIGFYNGEGQIEAYYNRIGGGLKKAYEQAKQTVIEKRRQAGVSPQPSPPPSPPATPPTAAQPPNEEEPRLQKIETAEADMSCGEELTSGRQKDSKDREIKCGKSMRLGDIKSPPEDSPTTEEIHKATWDRMTNENIQSLHPKIRKLAIDFINDAHSQGYKLRIVDGSIDEEQQSRSHTRFRESPPNDPAPRFVHSDAVNRHKSKHRPGGSIHQYGLAFDVMEIGPGPNQYSLKTFGENPYDISRWDEIGKIGKKHGLVWGGDLTSSPDAGDKLHFEFKHGLKIRGADGLLGRKRAKKVDEDGYVLI